MAADLFSQDFPVNHVEIEDDVVTPEPFLEIYPLASLRWIRLVNQVVEQPPHQAAVFLLNKVQPEISAPDLTAELDLDSDVWSIIMRLGGWKAVLRQLPMLEEVPYEQEQV